METTILSATINFEFYEKYFKGRKIEYIEIPKSKYKGQVIQDCSYSYSRACLKEHSNLLETIRKKHIGLPLITFKSFCLEDDYNFGAVEGLNALEGKNIVVVRFAICK